MPKYTVTTAKSTVYTGSPGADVLLCTPAGDDVDLFVNGEAVSSVTADDGVPTPVKKLTLVTQLEAAARNSSATLNVSAIVSA